jgi:predicted phage terminase large subunit-like protein
MTTTLDALEAALSQSLCQRRLIDLARETIPRYRAGWVHKTVARELEAFSRAVVAEESPRLILTMPPRHGKSVLAERFSVWHLGHHPDHETIFASYAKDPASDRTRAARECLYDEATQAAFPHLQLSDDTRGKVSWKITRQGGGGSVQAVGVRGSLTSKGAHVLIIDDPVKDWEEALSPLKRERAWDWYQSTAYTRLAPGAGVLLILTRWHEDDLAGRVLALTSDEGWRVVNFPAIAEVDEAHRKAGEALHPARYPLEALERIKHAIGSHKWRALYQQRPSSPGGSVWLREWWRYWSDTPRDDARARPKRFDETITSWDLTFGSKTAAASFVVGQAWGRVGADYFLLTERRGKWNFPETVAQILALARDYPRAKKHLVEKAANGAAVIAHLEGVLKGIEAMRPDGSKVARAHAVSAIAEAGHVFLPHPSEALWISDHIDECSAFPEGAHDDRVDAKSQALRYLKPRRRGIRIGRVH